MQLYVLIDILVKDLLDLCLFALFSYYPKTQLVNGNKGRCFVINISDVSMNNKYLKIFLIGLGEMID